VFSTDGSITPFLQEYKEASKRDAANTRWFLRKKLPDLRIDVFI
jgi:hypothetical protein